MDEQQEQREELNEELTRLVEPEVRKMSAVQRILSVFISPGELMSNIKEYPVFLVPYLVSVLIGLIAINTALQATEIINQELYNITIERYGADILNLGGQADVYGDIDDGINVSALISSAVSIIISPFIISFFAALVLWVLSKIFRCHGKLSHLFSMYMHIYILFALGSVISTSLMVMTGTPLDMTSLAAFLMPEGNMAMFSFNLLGTISITSVWSAILAYIGIKILADASSAKAGAITVISFLLYMAVSATLVTSTFLIFDMMGV